MVKCIPLYSIQTPTADYWEMVHILLIKHLHSSWSRIIYHESIYQSTSMNIIFALTLNWRFIIKTAHCLCYNVSFSTTGTRSCTNCKCSALHMPQYAFNCIHYVSSLPFSKSRFKFYLHIGLDNDIFIIQDCWEGPCPRSTSQIPPPSAAYFFFISSKRKQNQNFKLLMTE